MLLPSPGYAFMRLFSTPAGRTDYWVSLTTLFLIGLSGIMLASLLLPRRWQQGETAVATGRKASWRFRGVPPGPLAGIFAENPFYWLTRRDRLPQLIMWVAIGVLVPLWAIFLVTAFLGTLAPTPQT